MFQFLILQMRGLAPQSFFFFLDVHLSPLVTAQRSLLMECHQLLLAFLSQKKLLWVVLHLPVLLNRLN